MKGRWRELSEASGVPYSTLTKVAQGKTKNPAFETVAALDRALRGLAARLSGDAPPSPVAEATP